MIFYLILAIGIIVTTAIALDPSVREKGCTFFCGAFITSLVSLFYSLGVCGSPHLYKEVSRTDHTQELHSLKMSESYSGNFILGSGFVGGELRYYYYVKDDKGFFQLCSTSAHGRRIKEIESGTPHIFYQVIESKVSPWLHPFGFTSYTETSVDLYIPKGSIVEKFDPN